MSKRTNILKVQAKENSYGINKMIFKFNKDISSNKKKNKDKEVILQKLLRLQG